MKTNSQSQDENVSRANNREVTVSPSSPVLYSPQTALASEREKEEVECVKRKLNFDDDDDDTCSAEENETKLDAQEQLRATYEHERASEDAVGYCRYCLSENEVPDQMLVTKLTKTYVRVPWHQPLTVGHCLIVPSEHVSASTFMDEVVREEFSRIKRWLMIMFRHQGKDVVFLETSLRLESNPHLVWHCIPVPMDVGKFIENNFHKTILQLEDEWEGIPSSNRWLNRYVPKGKPFFSAEFGLNGNLFSHAIRNERSFPKDFAESVIGEMMDIDPYHWRHTIEESTKEQCKRVLQIRRWLSAVPSRPSRRHEAISK